MKIGIDIRMLGIGHGGIGRYVLELLLNMLAVDKENEYVLFFNGFNSDEADLEKLGKFSHARLVDVSSRHYSLMEQTKFLWHLNRHNLDLAHFPNFNVPLYYRKPFVVTIHDVVHHKLGGAKRSHLLHFLAYKKIIAHAAQASKKIITVSEFSKRDIARTLSVPEKKIHVVYEGASLDTDVTAQAVDRVKKDFLLSRPYFLFVGVLERKKNIVNLTRGFDEFLKQYGESFDLVIAGRADPHYPDIRYHALDIQNKDRVVFTGYVEDSELAALYKGAYAYVSASLHEGFGLPGVEAMRFGLPLITSNTEVFNEVYENAAIYFDPADVQDIAEKMYLLSRDEQFHKQMQEKSRSRGALFDWNRTAEETLKVYKETVQNF